MWQGYQRCLYKKYLFYSDFSQALLILNFCKEKNGEKIPISCHDFIIFLTRFLNQCKIVCNMCTLCVVCLDYV